MVSAEEKKAVDIRHLRLVMEIARWGSFTKAAEALYLTQPTVSKTIGQLEEELGVRLFARFGKRLELTEAGQAVIAQAGPIVQAFENLTTELSDLNQLRKGRIRLGLPPMAGAGFFPDVMGRFRERYPGLSLQMEEGGAKKIEADVASGALDVGVALLPVDEGLFNAHPFAREALQLVVHPAHPLAARAQVRLGELADEGFILFREDFTLHDRIIAECVRAGFAPRIVYESSQWDFIAGLAAARLGIALLPETICRTLDLRQVSVVHVIDPEIPWHLAMIWRKEGYLSLAARAWIDFVRERLPGLSKDKRA